MKGITLLVAAMALATVACGGGSSASAPAATDTTPAAETVPPAVTTAPAATPQPEATAAMTWDGTTCTYAGPTVVPQGTRLTVALTNTEGSMSGGRDGAAFLLMKVDDGITQQDFEAWGKDHPKGSDVPPWVDQISVQIVYPEQVKEGVDLVARQLNASRFILACGESPKDGEAMHFGTILETKEG